MALEYALAVPVAKPTRGTRRVLLAACICAELLTGLAGIVLVAVRGEVGPFVGAFVRLALMGVLSYLLWRGHDWAGWPIAALHAGTAVAGVLLGMLALRDGQPPSALLLLLGIVLFYGTLATLLGWLLVKGGWQKPLPLPALPLTDPTSQR